MTLPSRERRRPRASLSHDGRSFRKRTCSATPASTPKSEDNWFARRCRSKRDVKSASFAHLARPAFLAISDLLSAESALALAGPPARPPRRPSLTAQMFFMTLRLPHERSSMLKKSKSAEITWDVVEPVPRASDAASRRRSALEPSAVFRAGETSSPRDDPACSPSRRSRARSTPGSQVPGWLALGSATLGSVTLGSVTLGPGRRPSATLGPGRRPPGRSPSATLGPAIDRSRLLRRHPAP